MISLKGQKLLIIAPHPDDEVIGCGGLIQKIKAEGGKVFILFLTVGDTRDFSKKRKSNASERKKEIEKVASFLKYDKYDIALEGQKYHLKLDLLGQKKLMDIIERESAVSIEKVKPSMVAFPAFSSYNQDHRIVTLATHAALRPAEREAKHFVSTVLSYEEPADAWSIDQQTAPSVFVPITEEEVANKLKAVRLYRSQLRTFPNLRSVKTLESLAILRGSWASTAFAEAFTTHRIVL